MADDFNGSGFDYAEDTDRKFDDSNDFVLITNLSYVEARGVRMKCSALLLERRPSMFEDSFKAKPKFLMRGLGPEANWPVFELELPSLVQQVVHKGPNSGFRNTMLKLDGGFFVQLFPEDDTKPVLVESCLHASSDTILRLVAARCSQFWTKPLLPTLTWRKTELVRKRREI